MNSTDFRYRIRKIIGEKYIRESDKKLKQKDFAKKIGIEWFMLSHIMDGENEPTLEIIERILLAYPKINPDWLIFGNEPKFRETPKPKINEYCEPSAFELFKLEKRQILFKRISEEEFWEWTPEFIEINKEQLNWDSLSYNYSLPWNKELIENYLDKWNWNGITCIVAKMKDEGSRNALQFVNYVMKRYADKLNWSILCREKNFSDHYFTKYPSYIDWKVVSGNINFIWNRSFINKHLEQIDWQVFSESSFGGTQNSRQEAFRTKILHLYGKRLDLFLLSGNYFLLFTPDVIEKYKEKWNWHELINNPYIEWNMDMFEKYDSCISKTVSPDEFRSSYLSFKLMKQELVKQGIKVSD